MLIPRLLTGLCLLSLSAPALAGDALWFTGGAGSTGTVTTLRNTLIGVGSTGLDSTSAWPAAGLTSYKLVFLPSNTVPFSSTHVSDLQAYIATGNVLVVIVDSFTADAGAASTMNDLLAQLGVSSRFGESSNDLGCNKFGVVVDSTHPLTSGITTLSYGGSNEVIAGEAGRILVEDDSGLSLVVAEENVILVADNTIFEQSCTLDADNKLFFEDLYTGACYATGSDDDGDGYVSRACGGSDCADDDALTFPGGDEYCDGVDNDCDLTADDSALDPSSFYPDSDGDGYGTPGVTTDACDPPAGYAVTDDDCDDADPFTFPGAAESESSTECLTDVDLDGWGSAVVAAGVTAGTDCDDNDDAAYPENPEVCDTADNDCDGTVDEGVTSPFYQDLDGDKFGADTTIQACKPSPGYSLESGDCDDADAFAFPGAAQLESGEECMADADNDGWGDSSVAGDVVAGVDCDDAEQETFPGAAQNESPDACMADADRDGWGSDAPPAGVEAGVDCDDDERFAFPGAAELESTTDCMVDSDNDGWGGDSPATASTVLGQDCDDEDADFNPEQIEFCDGEDEDCDGAPDDNPANGADYYQDLDGDTYGDGATYVRACEPSADYVANSGDCDDDDDAINPAGVEYCDGIDNDCDSVADNDDAADAAVWYQDLDGDGYGNEGQPATACDLPAGYAAQAGDCDDEAPGISPGSAEYCNGADEDCDGDIDEDPVDPLTFYQDADGDGYGNEDEPLAACAPPAGYTAVPGDCDDDDPKEWTEIEGLDATCTPDGGGGGDEKGCSHVGGGFAGLWGLGALLAGLRRRRS